MMTREEAVEYWMPIVDAVFVAENKIKDTWLPKLIAAKGGPDILETCYAYVRAVATEIVDHGNIEFGED